LVRKAQAQRLYLSIQPKLATLRNGPRRPGFAGKEFWHTL
jgi:hypothetical protein